MEQEKQTEVEEILEALREKKNVMIAGINHDLDISPEQDNEFAFIHTNKISKKLRKIFLNLDEIEKELKMYFQSENNPEYITD